MLENDRLIFIFHYPFDFFSPPGMSITMHNLVAYVFCSVRLPTLGEGAQQHLPRIASESSCCMFLDLDVSPKGVYILKTLWGKNTALNHGWH